MYIVYILNLVLLIIFFNNSKKISKKFSLFKKTNDNTPIVGGLGIYSYFILNTLSLYFFENKIISNNLSILILISSIFFIGLIDDIFNLSYKLRLLLIFLVIFIFLNFNNEFIVKQLYFETINKTFIISNFSYFLTPFFILLLINSLNMADGINGNSGLIFLCYFMIIFSHNSQLNAFLFIIVVSIIIFLFFNFKNLLYIGDSGIYFISIFVSLYLIDSYNQNLSNLSCEKIFLLLMIPGIDMFRLFCIRIYNKKNPFKGDLNHLHHILIKRFNLIYSLVIYTSLILWPFIILIFFNTNIFYLIFTNLVFYFLLIWNLDLKKSY
jgi:UDP-GlcNAc:undecaprenyl-phosphate GlcNAc-1-phosphate transferase